VIIFIFFSEAHTHTKKNMSADSITCNMNGSIHTIDYPADATGEGIRRTLAERTGHPFDLIELIHAEGVLADREVVARGAELTVMIKPAPLLLPGMSDTPEFRQRLFDLLLLRNIEHTDQSDGPLKNMRWTLIMTCYDDDDEKHIRALLQEHQAAGYYSDVWRYESEKVRVSNDAGRLKTMAYEALCKLMSEVRHIRECSRCTKKRRIMEGTTHCMDCLLAPLAEEQ
jgi:hypothetical protein